MQNSPNPDSSASPESDPLLNADVAAAGLDVAGLDVADVDVAGGEGSGRVPLPGPVTAFGSWRHNPVSAAALLRARAAAAGAPLRDADRVDLVAATIGAECWMFALNASSLNNPVRHGQHAVACLAAVLARAAGIAEVQDCPPLDAAELDTKKILLVEELANWARHEVPGNASEVLRRAAADLSAGAPDDRFEAMAGLLMIVADTSATSDNT